MENGRKSLYVDLGLMSVTEAELMMISATKLRAKGELPDILFFPIHPKTVALGLRDRSLEQPRDLLVSPERLRSEGILLTRSVRGGGITYHWPGQVICYPLLALRPSERDVPAFMGRLEEVGIRTFESFGVTVTRRRDSAAHLGLWWEGRKAASMGVRFSSWVTSFGFAINVGGDLTPSRYIRPCGIEGARLVSLAEILGKAPLREEVLVSVRENFSLVFSRSLERMPNELVHEIRSLARPSDATIAGSR